MQEENFTNFMYERNTLMENRLYVDNKKNWEKLCNREWKIDKELSVKVVEDGYILPMLDMKQNGHYMGGVTDAKFKFVAGLLRNNPSIDTDDPKSYGCNKSYIPRTEDIRQIVDDCVFGGVLCFHFGHFILESMGRLWHYLHIIEENTNDTELPYICFTVIKEKQKWFDDFFSFLGIPQDRIIYADKPLHFRRIIVPEESIHSWHSFHPNYMLPYRKILSAIEPSPYRKIYLTRTAYKKAGTYCVNEEYFEKFFEERGFQVISMEKHTIKEQIAFISGADVLVSTLGTLSHFALFTKLGTKVISLLRSSRDTLPPQCVIVEAAESCHYIIDVASNFLYETRTSGVSVIGPTSHWNQFVRDFFGEECKDIIDAKTYMHYFTEWLKYYNNPSRYHVIRDIDNFDMIRQSAKVLLNEELDKSKYNLGKTKKDYQKIIENQEKIIASDKDYYKEIRLQNAIEIRQRNCMNQCMEKINQYGLIDISDGNIVSLKRMFQGENIIDSSIIYYKVHGADYGWTDIYYEDEIAGRQCSGKRLEAFKLDSIDGGVQFVYSAYIEGQGWSGSVSNGETAGSVGKALPVRSVRIEVVNNNDLDISVRYRASLNGQWSEYAYDGEALNTFDWEFFEALQINLVLNPVLCSAAFDKIAQVREKEKREKQRLDERVAVLNQEITRLQENCNEFADDNDKLKKEVQILQKNCYKFADDNDKLEKEIQSLQKNCNEFADDKEKLEQEIQTLQIKFIQLENSFSWRITKPLRIIRFWWLNRKRIKMNN